MCGIVGIFSPTTLTDSEIGLFKGLLAVDIIRGSHATGVAKVNTYQNKVSIHKRAEDAYDFLASDATKKFLETERGNILIGHNRFATMGNKADHDNAHPFQEGHITLVHNGGQSTWSLDLLEGYKDPEVEVDSHMVCKTIAAHGIKKAVEEHLDGAFSLVWWDSKERSLNFCRNDERPMYIAALPGNMLVWASEKTMLDAFLDRTGAKSKYTMTPTSTTVGDHIKFRFDNIGKLITLKPVVEELVFLDLPVPASEYGAANAHWFGQSSGSYGSQSGSSGSNGNGSNIYQLREQTRINNILKQAGLAFEVRSLLTCDVTAVEPYNGNEEWCKVQLIERETKTAVQIWGLNTAEVKDRISVIRCNVANAYNITSNGKQVLTITADCAGISCHDPKYHMGTPCSLSTQGSATKSSYPIIYPLKAHGHTFLNSYEFSDFVCQGCMTCGKVPTPYDRRNMKLTVVQRQDFTGLLSECDFMCGECSEE